MPRLAVGVTLATALLGCSSPAVYRGFRSPLPLNWACWGALLVAGTWFLCISLGVHLLSKDLPTGSGKFVIKLLGKKKVLSAGAESHFVSASALFRARFCASHLAVRSSTRLSQSLS